MTRAGTPITFRRLDMFKYTISDLYGKSCQRMGLEVTFGADADWVPYHPATRLCPEEGGYLEDLRDVTVVEATLYLYKNSETEKHVSVRLTPKVQEQLTARVEKWLEDETHYQDVIKSFEEDLEEERQSNRYDY
jgi:hypothetical protein